MKIRLEKLTFETVATVERAALYLTCKKEKIIQNLRYKLGSIYDVLKYIKYFNYSKYIDSS